MAEMSPRRQRVHDAFRHREADRVPLFEQSIASDVASEILGREAFTGTTYLHYQEAAWWMRGVQAHREFEERLSQDTLAIARALDFDLLNVPWRMPERPSMQVDEHTFLYGDTGGDHSLYRFDPQAKTFGCQKRVRVAGDIREPEQLEPEIAALEERARTYGTDDALAELQEHRRLLEEHGEEYEVLGSGFINVPLEEVWLVACIARPDLVERWLDAQLEIQLRRFEVQARLGLKVIWGGGDLADNNGPVYGPGVFRELLLPRIRTMTRRCHELGLCYLFRTDGNLEAIEEDFFVRSGIDGYGEIDHEAGMTLERLKPRYGERITFWGNLPCGTTLFSNSPQEVIDQTRRMIDIAAPGGGYIFGSSNSIIPNTPARNVLAMYETAREHGRY